MSFLTPLFLLGGLALALPVIFHLIRRTTRERTVFSSLMFLLPTPPRLTKRSRLEHWLLLLLRLLALALLALGFARPFFKETMADEAVGAGALRRIVLVDTSASMRRAGLWDEARARVERDVRETGPGDQVAVFAFGRSSRPLVSFGDWTATPPDARAALVKGKLAEVSPGWGATNLGAALIAAAEALVDTEGTALKGPREIVLVSDLAAGSHTEVLQGYEWPKGVTLRVETVAAKAGTNASVQLLADQTDGDRQTAASVRVRVSNAADAKREQFSVGWAAAAGAAFGGAPVETYVPPGQSRIVTLPVVAGAAQTIALRGDDEDFDNTVFVIPAVAQKIAVAYVGAEAADDARQPLYFLRRALPATPRLNLSIAPIPAGAAVPAESALVVVTDALTAGQAAALREQVLAGKTVLAVPKNAAAAVALAPLLGLATLPVEEGRPKSYAMLAEIDFKHPLFAAFADPRFSDFTKIHFWKYRRFDFAAVAEVRVLAKFDNGDPAITEIPAGKGRVVVLASGWNTEDSQLAVSSKFVPLLYALLEWSGALATPGAAQAVDEPIALNIAEGERTVVTGPTGPAVTLEAGAKNFTATQPGIYRFETAGRTEVRAVNLDPLEARTAPLPGDELERLGAPVARVKAPVADPAGQQVALQGAEAEGRQKLWRWFVVATLLFLLGESLLAGLTARRNAPSPTPLAP